MKCFRGKAAYKDIALGNIYVFHKKQYEINREPIEDIEAELARFSRARQKAVEQLGELSEKTKQETGKDSATIIQAQQIILLDEEYIKTVEQKIIEESMNAEYAVFKTGMDLVYIFTQMEDEYTRERAVDIQDVTERMIRCLGDKTEELTCLKDASIIVAEELTPSETIHLDKSKILAFVTVRGSVNSHVAILAKTMNIPALVNVDMDISQLESGMEALVDGENEVFIVEPDTVQKEQALNKIEAKKKENAKLQELIGKEDITLGGKKVSLFANVGSLEDIQLALENDAGGVGLFRSEFLYMGKNSLPTEQEQFEVYKQAAELVNGRKIIIRTMDIGADKQTEYFNLEKEENPALGYRAIRICLVQPEILKTQLKALYRAAVYGDIAIMYPMITSIEEVEAIHKLSKEAKAELAADNIPYKDVEEGIMIETPAAALISDELAKMVDFLSLGTNDLTQYTLAIDRQNGKLDAFYNPYHKAVLKMIHMTVENAHKEGKWAGICGELADDEKLTEWFLQIGVDELSVAPASILNVRRKIRSLK